MFASGMNYFAAPLTHHAFDIGAQPTKNHFEKKGSCCILHTEKVRAANWKIKVVFGTLLSSLTQRNGP